MTRQWRKRSSVAPLRIRATEIRDKEGQQAEAAGEETNMENHKERGALIQAYVRAKWTDKSDQSQIIELSGQLGREVMQRVNALGLDAEKLLEVTADEALSRLEMLENEALLEDAGGRAAAIRQQPQRTGAPAPADRPGLGGRRDAPGRPGRR